MFEDNYTFLLMTSMEVISRLIPTVELNQSSIPNLKVHTRYPMYKVLQAKRMAFGSPDEGVSYRYTKFKTPRKMRLNP